MARVNIMTRADRRDVAGTPDRDRGKYIEGRTVTRLRTTNTAPGSSAEGLEVPVVTHAPRRGFAAGIASAALALAGLAFSPSALASFLPPEMMDTAAMGLAWFVIVAVPIGGIVLFWMVHVLPEKIAHKRNHPQTQAIQVLCLLSLVFGGMLWTIAWLWAYSQPVLYKMAYATDRA